MPTVTLVWRDGREERVTVGSEPSTGDGTTVLEAAEAAGLSLPYGCRTGVCGTCTGRLLAGNLGHEREPRALKPAQRDDGYVLPCLAVASADCTIEVGADVHRDLLRNPWRHR